MRVLCKCERGIPLWIMISTYPPPSVLNVTQIHKWKYFPARRQIDTGTPFNKVLYQNYMLVHMGISHSITGLQRLLVMISFFYKNYQHVSAF